MNPGEIRMRDLMQEQVLAQEATHILILRTEEEAREYSRKRVLPMLEQELEHASAPAPEVRVLEGELLPREEVRYVVISTAGVGTSNDRMRRMWEDARSTGVEDEV